MQNLSVNAVGVAWRSRVIALTVAVSATATLVGCDKDEPPSTVEPSPTPTPTPSTDPCEHVVCKVNASCDERDGSCGCDAGFVDVGDGCEAIACTSDDDCSDALACNGEEVCNLATNACEPGTPVACEANATCVEDTAACACDEGFAGEADNCTAIDLRNTCVMMTTSDWASSAQLAVYDVDNDALKDEILSYDQDSAVHLIDDEFYVVTRQNDERIMHIDPQDDFSIVWEGDLTANYTIDWPNVHSVVRYNNDLYLAAYNTGTIYRSPVPTLTTPFALEVMHVIPPKAWDGEKAELTQLVVIGDTLFGLTQGLADSWTCDTADNKGEIHAFSLPAVTPKLHFNNGQSSVLTLEHCNPFAMIPLDDGTHLVHSLGTYRQYNSLADDGGIQIVDLVNGTAGPVVATESDLNDMDIYSIVHEAGAFYINLVGTDAFSTEVRALLPASTPSGTWSIGPTLYTGNVWTMALSGDSLFLADRDFWDHQLVRLDRHTGDRIGQPIQTDKPIDSMLILRREGACWSP